MKCKFLIYFYYQYHMPYCKTTSPTTCSGKMTHLKWLIFSGLSFSAIPWILHVAILHVVSSDPSAPLHWGSNEHVLVLVLTPLSHVLEQSDHAPQSLNISINLILKSYFILEPIFNCEGCLQGTTTCSIRNKTINEYCIMSTWSIRIEYWICIINQCIHCWLKFYTRESIFWPWKVFGGVQHHVLDNPIRICFADALKGQSITMNVYQK